MNRSGLYILLFAFCAVLLFWRLGATPLLGFDEQIYSECSREMLASGDYVVPRVDGTYFFDKPPLVYWMQAASMRVLGVNSLGARLPSALVALLLVGWTVFLGNRVFGKNSGLYAGFALASSILFAGISRMAIMDQAFSLTISLALGAFLLAYLGVWPRWGYVLAWAAMGLTSLVKGPAGVVLVLITAGVFLALRRDWRGILRATPVLGPIVMLAIALPWYVIVHKETGGAFTQEFIFHQNLARAMGKDFYHNSPFFIYLPIFALGFFPWSIFVIKAWSSHVKLRPADDDKTGQAALFAAVWFVSIIGVFSVAVSKLPGYILPAFPGAALLVGLMWSRIVESGKTYGLRPYVMASAVVASIFGAACLALPMLLPRPIPGLPTALVPMSVCLFVASLVAVLLVRGNKVAGLFAALCAGVSGFVICAVWLGLPIASLKMSDPMVNMAQAVRRVVPSGDVVVAYMNDPGQPALGFYAGRPIPDKDDGNQHSGKNALSRVLNTGKTVYIIAQEGKLDGLPAGMELVTTYSPYLLYRSGPR